MEVQVYVGFNGSWDDIVLVSNIVNWLYTYPTEIHILHNCKNTHTQTHTRAYIYIYIYIDIRIYV